LESQIKEISYEELSARLTDEAKKLGGEGEPESLPARDSEAVQANLSRAKRAAIGGAPPRKCEKCGRIGHREADCWKSEDAPECTYCGRKGHTEESGCFTKEFQEKKGGMHGQGRPFASLAYAAPY
jgi:hypothetical protein